MRHTFLIFSASLALLLATSCDKKPSGEAPKEVPVGVEAPAPAFGPFDGLKNASMVSETLMAAGQPTQAQFETLRDMGLKVVVTLRTDGEVDFDEEKRVVDLGMTFVSIPIEGEGGLTQNNVEIVNRALGDFEGQNVLLHCGSSNRVGAMLALREGWLRGVDADKAVALGKKAGLSSLETAVVDNLKEPVKP